MLLPDAERLSEVLIPGPRISQFGMENTDNDKMLPPNVQGISEV